MWGGDGGDGGDGDGGQVKGGGGGVKRCFDATSPSMEQQPGLLTESDDSGSLASQSLGSLPVAQPTSRFTAPCTETVDYIINERRLEV